MGFLRKRYLKHKKIKRERKPTKLGKVGKSIKELGKDVSYIAKQERVVPKLRKADKIIFGDPKKTPFKSLVGDKIPQLKHKKRKEQFQIGL